MSGAERRTTAPDVAVTTAVRTEKQWTSRSIGADWQHKVFYALIRFGGRQWAYALLVFVVLYYTLFRRDTRERSRHYLWRRFPGRGSLAGLWDSYLLNLGIGRTLVDRAVLGILGAEPLSISLAGKEQLTALLAEGKGLVLVTAHVGCWQLAMSSLSALDTPVNLVIHREEGDLDRHFFEHGGGEAPCRIIDPAGFLGGTLEMLQALKNRELLCIMGDRVMGSEGGTLRADFLGGKVALPFSPYRLASVSGAPIAVLFPFRSESGVYAMKLATVIRVPDGLGRSPGAYLPFAGEFIAALEQFVAEYPYQFFNFFDMWSDNTPSETKEPLS
jgi:predicted LPLAT superfamily acyltransferase